MLSSAKYAFPACHCGTRLLIHCLKSNYHHPEKDKHFQSIRESQKKVNTG